tara:strand:+ start:26551 stop:27567 length:1017 start_codon:yes stop_codon:yes gene_type:complete
MAFLLSVTLGGSGRNLALLTAGATLSGAIGIFAIQWIRDQTRLAEDTAIGTVLSVFFGIGVVLLSHIQTMKTGAQAGLNSFLLGSTAMLTSGEALLISISSAVAIGCSLAFIKEFRTVAFDKDFAKAQGWQTSHFDLIMLALLLAIMAIGLKTVGLVLIIALVIVPPATARFWTNRLGCMIALSGLFGGLSGWIGGAFSALYPNMPAGAVIVLTAASIFTFSLLCAPKRGVITRSICRLRLRFFALENRGLISIAGGYTPLDPITRYLFRWRGYMDPNGKLTASGVEAAAEANRQRRLWFVYRRHHPDADISLGLHNGRPIEEMLSPEILARLERERE